MLKIFNDMEPFFRDNYRRINVREYARMLKISPPSASTLLEQYRKEGILNREEERNYIFYFASRENTVFVHLSKIFWSIELRKSGIMDYLERGLVSPLIILFGSFSKAEVKKGSDIDIAIFTPVEKRINPINIVLFEDKLKHKIQIFTFKHRENVKNEELLNNILNGHIISGSW